MSSDALNQEILQVSSQLLEKSRLAQQEQERAREISDSLSQLPQQQTDARRQLTEVERRLGAQNGNTPQAQAQNLGAQAESARLKALVDELELAQLSANNRQELARMRSELAQKQSQQLDAYLQALRNQLNSQRQREAERALESTELLAENSDNLPAGIVEQFRVNRELSAGAESTGAAYGSGGLAAAAGHQSNLSGSPGAEHPARAVPVARGVEPAGRSAARPGRAPAGNAQAAAAGYRDGPAARSAPAL